MSKVSAWWSSWGFGRAGQRAETDFADMGTAFGLDASFGRHEGGGEPAPAPASDRYVSGMGALDSTDPPAAAARP